MSTLKPQPLDESLSRSIDTSNKDISRLLESGIALDQLEEIREGFELFENPRNQRVDLTEMLESLEGLGFADKFPTICRLMQEVSKDYRNGIKYDTFLRELNRRIGEKSNRKEIRKIFDLFDKKRKGSLNLDDFKIVAREIGETLSDHELEELILESSDAGEELITPDDFYFMMVRSADFGKHLK